MKAIRRTALGDRRSVLAIDDIPDIGHVPAGCVLLEMQYAPINQHDLHYQMLPAGLIATPATAGFEGAGKVIACGESVSESLLGACALAQTVGTWTERLLVRAKTISPLPKADPLQLSMLSINPTTASLLLSEFTILEPGDWVVQNAASSGVGRAVIAFARQRGIRTLNLVRRSEVMEEIAELADAAVLLDRDSELPRMHDVTGGAPLRLALDAVGGASTGRLARMLSPGGALVRYGRMDGHRAPPDLASLLRDSLHRTARLVDRHPSLVREILTDNSTGPVFWPRAQWPVRKTGTHPPLSAGTTRPGRAGQGRSQPRPDVGSRVRPAQ